MVLFQMGNSTDFSDNPEQNVSRKCMFMHHSKHMVEDNPEHAKSV